MGRIKNTWLFLLITTLLISISGSQLAQSQGSALLAGEISLTLRGGLWQATGERIVHRDLTLDLTCEKGRCQSEIWGYAPEFNQADHQGTLAFQQLGISPSHPWRLAVNLTVSPDPWLPLAGEAIYHLQLWQRGEGLVGTYTGTFNRLPLQGQVVGTIAPPFPQPVPHHQPLTPQEHPRLMFRRHQLSNLRQKAKTASGRAILDQLGQTLTQPIQYEGYVPDGGYHAAGHCFLALLAEDAPAAERGWQIAQTAMNRPSPRLLEQSPTVAGIALAYDLCYPWWDEERRQITSRWLAQSAEQLIIGTADGGWNPTPWSNWNGRARAAAGLAALALLGEPASYLPPETKPQKLLTIAERNVKRYLTSALGKRGFGSEGDHYTTEPLLLTVLPFLQAERNAAGQDFVQASGASWVLPHYLLRAIAREGKLAVATYGRHRNYGEDSLFAVGLGTVPARFLPAVLWAFRCYLQRGREGLFDFRHPHEAAYAFVGYPTGVAPRHPAEVLERVLVDEAKGFYAFRNRWQDGDDFVAAIYLKREQLARSWSFPEGGSFRLWGLGGRWAEGGPGDGRRDSENVPVGEGEENPTTQPLFFASSGDGSGTVSLQGEGWVRAFAADYSRAAGVPGLFVVVDSFTNQQAERTWVMHTAERQVKVQGQQFTIEAASGATMQGTFIAPSGVKLSFQPTGQGGKLLARGGGEFFVVLTVQKGPPPTVQVSGTGLGAIVGVNRQRIVFREGRLELRSQFNFGF